jgi:hypothetical protein
MPSVSAPCRNETAASRADWHLNYPTDSGAPHDIALNPGPAGAESPGEVIEHWPPPQMGEGTARLDKRTKAQDKTPADCR